MAHILILGGGAAGLAAALTAAQTDPTARVTVLERRDVYKRQLFIPSGGVSPLYFLRNYGVLLIVSVICCTPLIEKIWNPVSYTHLDVYKRQAHSSHKRVVQRCFIVHRLPFSTF